MDHNRISELLKATIDYNQREAAEKQLELLHKIIGFAPCLLQVVMNNAVEMPVRQAGAVYLKNQISQNWKDREADSTGNLAFHIHEQDRGLIRDILVDATVAAPNIIRVQLAQAVNHIIRHDFPHRWPRIVEKISLHLQAPESNSWLGALICLYQLVKVYEYKKNEDRQPLLEALAMLFPMVYQNMCRLLSDSSEISITLQKQILKIFFSLIQYSFPLQLITKEVFANWMQVFCSIIQAPVPESCNQVDEEERPDLVWWKNKKWAHHIITRVFERYGSPGNVTKEYKEFAPYYLKTFSNGVLQAFVDLLSQYKQGRYLTPRIVQQILHYLAQAVTHAHTWNLLKQYMPAIIEEIIFPLMCHNDKDEELWKEDPQEFIRLKFDVFEDYVSPVIAAQNLLSVSTSKRKDLLNKVWAFLMTNLNGPVNNPRQKDGAFHIIGTISSTLLKKKQYRPHMEDMIVKLIFPEFQSPCGFLRARACWTLHHFSTCKFKNPDNIVRALTLLQHCLLNDNELPVKVEAAIGLQTLINNQNKAAHFMEQNIRPIALELLKIIRDTQSDDLTNVMQKIVYTYPEQILPIAVEMTVHLAETFKQVLENGDENSEERTITAMGLLNTVDTILSVMDEQPEIMAQLEPLVLNLTMMILTENCMEFYEEALCLLYTVTTTKISDNLWKAFELLYQTFEKDGLDFFTDMMPIIHNFITVDTPAFLSNQNHLIAVYQMCKKVLESNPGEDPECHAAKLLEVVLIQCKGNVDGCIPMFVELCLKRLIQPIQTSELRTMLLQVIIAALYANPRVLFETLEYLRIPSTGETYTNHFLQQWLKDCDCFIGIHDRKMCVLGWCTILGDPASRPAILANIVQSILPQLLLVFQGLKWAYAFKAQEDEAESEEEEVDDELNQASDDEDVEDEDSEYLERLAAQAKAHCPFPVTASDVEELSESDDGEDGDENQLESFTTVIDDEDCEIDEYVVFKSVLQNLQTADPNFYNALTSQLTNDQQKGLQEVFVLADRKKALIDSKQIEKEGGYQFDQKNIPTSFNFASNNPFS